MGKKRDYTRYSKGPVESSETIEVEVADNSIETAAELSQPVEVEVETTTEVMQTAKVEQEPEVEEPKIEESKFVTGIVTDCVKLNVREDPDPTATILGTITAATELIVSKEESTEDYYKICTSVGLEGYCMKKFITIMP